MMFNKINLDEISIWQSATHLVKHINEHSQKHVLSAHFVEDTQDLIAHKTSTGAAARVLVELVSIASGEPQDPYLKKYIHKILRSDLQVYLYSWQVAHVWAIPRQKLHLYKLDSLPCEEMEWGPTYLWEDLINHFK